MVKSATKVKNTKQTQSTKQSKSSKETKNTKQVKRTVRRSASSKVDELKLGKFEKQAPLRLPEARARRVWQVIGGVALMMIAGFCLVSMVLQVPFAYLWQTETDIWQTELTPLTISWIVNNVTLVVFTVLCLVTSVLLFARRHVPAGVWYLLIILLVVGFVSQSVGIYQNYTLRDCVEATCPMVVGELSVVLLCDLVIMMVAVILLWLIYCLTKSQNMPEQKRRR